MSNIIPFHYHQKSIRVIRDNNDEPWFVAHEICDALDLKWSGDKASLSKIREEWKMRLKISDSLGRLQETILINESGLYKLAFRSNKQEAEAFTDWLAEKVIPQIRKTGQYKDNHCSFSEDEIIYTKDQVLDSLNRWSDLQDQMIALLKKENKRLEKEKKWAWEEMVKLKKELEQLREE